MTVVDEVTDDTVTVDILNRTQSFFSLCDSSFTMFNTVAYFRDNFLLVSLISGFSTISQSRFPNRTRIDLILLCGSLISNKHARHFNKIWYSSSE